MRLRINILPEYSFSSQLFHLSAEITEVVLIVLILLPNAGCVVLVDSFWVFMPRLSEKASMFNVARYTVIECQFNVWHRKKTVS